MSFLFGINRSFYFDMALIVSLFASSSAFASVRGFDLNIQGSSASHQKTAPLSGNSLKKPGGQQRQNGCFSLSGTDFFGEGVIGQVCEEVILGAAERSWSPLLKEHKEALRLAALSTADPVRQMVVLEKKKFAGHVLGHTSLPIGNAEHDKNWRGVLKRAQADMAQLEACLNDQDACAGTAINKWSAIVLAGRQKLGTAQLAYVNRAINRASRYRTDLQNFGRRDYWTSPIEFLSSNGDCEDFAIGKYFTLRALGVPAANMRLVIMKNTRNRKDHAVLVVNNGEKNLVLDNLSDTLRSERDLAYYRPVYSLNEERKWAFLPKPRYSRSEFAKRKSARFPQKMAKNTPVINSWTTTVYVD